MWVKGAYKDHLGRLRNGMAWREPPGKQSPPEKEAPEAKAKAGRTKRGKK